MRALALLPLVVAGAVSAQAPARPTARDPAAAEAGVPPLPTDDELRALAARDAATARSPLRRAARTADAPATRALALRLLAAHDPSTATARICARSLRLDPVPVVRRAGAECLGRLGPRLASVHTPALVAALHDESLDVVTMTGWALANVGEPGAITAIVEGASHPDERVAKLFSSYAERMRDRLGLGYEAEAAPVPEGPRPVPPGVALVIPAQGMDTAAAASWLGLYGVMGGWFHGSLLSSAHGGVSGGGVAPLAGLGFAALGAAAASGYAFSRAPSLPLAHTVVQLGTFGTLLGYGAGQLSGFPPSSMVTAANLALLGTVAGTGLGIASVETAPPTIGALGAGLVAAIGTGLGAGALARSYQYPGGPAFGVMLLSGSAAGVGTTLALSQLDLGLFPLVGASTGMLLLGGAAGGAAALVEPTSFSVSSGWLVVCGLAGGAALGGALAFLLPAEADPLLQGKLQLRPPQLGMLPALRPGDEPAAVALVSGTF